MIYILMAGLFFIVYYILACIKYKKNRKKYQAIGNKGESKISHILSDFLHCNDLTFHTGKRTVQIDHVVQLKNGSYLILETKNWAGELTGRMSENYIKVNNKKRFNPVIQASWQKQALMKKLNKNAFFFIVSVGSMTYPREFERCILKKDALYAYLKENAVSKDTSYRNWSLIEGLIQKDANGSLKRSHLKKHEKRNSPSPIPFIIGLTMIAYVVYTYTIN